MDIKKIVMCFVGIFILLSLYSEDDKGNSIVEVGSVNSGYLFYDGKYIEAPYEFTRKGFSVFVNGNKLYFPEIIIKHLLPNRNIENVKISDIPKDISYEEFNNPEKPWCVWKKNQIKSIIKKYPDDYMKHLMLFYKKLPFIKKVQSNSTCSNELDIETYSGLKVDIDFNGFFEHHKPEKIYTKKDVEKIIEKQIALNNIKDLNKGACIFLFSDSLEKWVLSSGDVKNNLPEIIDVLNSKDSNNVKINKLYRLRLFKKRKNKRAEILVNNFSPNKQLSERIADILNERKVTNFKRIKIEDKPTKKELSAKRMEAIKVVEEKWRKEHPGEYERQKENMKLFVEKRRYLAKKGKKYWDNHKEEYEKLIKELKKLRSGK